MLLFCMCNWLIKNKDTKAKCRHLKKLPICQFDQECSYVFYYCFACFSLSKIITLSKHLHCKKSWRSSSTPASGDAGPKHTGVEQSFRHPWRKFYYKYRTFPTFFTSVELVRQSWKVSKAACGARTFDLQDYNIY